MKMMTKRKPSLYEVQADYGHGFECVATENTLNDAKSTLRRYVGGSMACKTRIKKIRM